MDLIALAVPFFLFALVVELIIDRLRGSRLYRANDAINSLSAGIFKHNHWLLYAVVAAVGVGFRIAELRAN